MFYFLFLFYRKSRIYIKKINNTEKARPKMRVRKSASEKVRPKKCVRKSASEKELLFVRLGVRKITFFIKSA
jgi:hypothetical protein